MRLRGALLALGLSLGLGLGGCAAPEREVDMASAAPQGSPAEQARVQAALATGDGVSTDSPIQIGRIGDAYLVLRRQGWAFRRQALLRERDQVFDLFTVAPRGGRERQVVFSLVAETAAQLRIARAVRLVMTSGDGQGFATAFATPSAPLEDEVLRLLGFQREAAAAVRRDGHAFDVVTVVDPSDGSRREVYFRLLEEPPRREAGLARRT